jgi:transposase
LTTHHAAGDRRVFPPIVATHLIKLACELPDEAGRSLSTWTCAELARTLRDNGIVDAISPQSVQRILSSHRLKPWRVHHWLSSKVPRDETFRAQVVALCELYTRPLGAHERVLCVDEKTSLQPRTRTAPTRPAQPGGTPVQIEHEYQRKGALNLLAAFDTRSGQVIGICRKRKRQAEFIELLEAIEAATPPSTTVIHIVCDNVRTHKGKLVCQWLAKHRRFQFHFTPVHCSWMNQVEQWFSILQRKRLRVPNFDDLSDLENKILTFVDEWNVEAVPFNWTRKSFEKTLAKVDAVLMAA